MKVLLATAGNDVAPRFDLTVEVIITHIAHGAVSQAPRELLLSEPSGDELCALAVSESVDTVICGGIDEVHREYLAWKKIRIIDGVIGPYREALELLAADQLAQEAVLPGARAH